MVEQVSTDINNIIEEDIIKPFTPEEIDNLLTEPSDLGYTEEEINKLLGLTPSKSSFDISEFGITGEGFSLSGEGDAFFNKLAIGTDNALSGLSEGVGLLLNQMGFEDSAKSWRDTAEEYRISASVRPQPTQSASITEEFPEIAEKFSQGQVGEAISKTLGQMETLTATALPSLAPAAGGYALASTLLAFIPGIGTGAALAIRLASILAPSYLTSSGEIYKKSKDLGAAEDDASKAAIVGGLASGAVESFGAGLLINSVSKAVGKKGLTDYFSEYLGKDVAEELVENGIKAGSVETLKKTAKNLGKGFGKGAVTEGGTEAVQQAITIGAANEAADTFDKLDSAEVTNEIIDAAALGIFGGGPVRGLTEALAPLTKRQAVIKAEELDKEIDDFPTLANEQETDLDTRLQSGFTTAAQDRKSNRIIDELSKMVSRSVSYLQPLANRSEIGARLVNDVSNFFLDTNPEIGNATRQVQDILYDVKKDFRIPFTSLLPKEINDAIAKQLRYGERASNPKVAEVADKLREVLGDVQRDSQGNIILDENNKPIATGGLYKDLVDSGVDIGFIDNYLTQLYKIPMTGLGRSKAKKEFIRILQKNNYKNPNEILENIINHNGVYTPDEGVTLFEDFKTESDIPIVEQSFEKPRGLDPQTVRELDEAGLVERNVIGLMGKAIIGAKKRAKLQQLKNRYGDKAGEMGATPDEIDRVRDIFKSLQNNYKPFSSKSHGKILGPVYQFLNTAGYLVTLPLAGITSLSEPLIMLSRVSPKNALWGAIQGVKLGGIKTARSWFPKMKTEGMTAQLERSMNGLLQTADLALNDAVRDIGDLSINKKITDTFFRANMLAQVTQVSRYMAFAATQKQIQEDIQTLQKAEIKGGKPTTTITNAKRRLKEQGLGNIFKNKASVTDKNVNAKIDELEKLREEYDNIKNIKGKNRFHTANKQKKIRKEFRSSNQGRRLRQLTRELGSKKKVEEMSNRDEILDWADKFGQEGVEVTEPPIITKAIGKTVDEIIMTPNVVNRPLWMSNPWLSPVAQLKGFMMVFGNTVGTRFFREVFKPLAGYLPGSKQEEGRIPLEEAMKYAMTFTLLLSAIYGATVIKDAIKYGDEDSPTDELEGYDLLAYLIKSTNILGFGNVVIDALNSKQYGIPFPFSVAGPVPVKMIQLSESLIKLTEGNPSSIANFISKNTPIVGVFPYEGESFRGIREGTREAIEESLEPVAEFFE